MAKHAMKGGEPEPFSLGRVLTHAQGISRFLGRPMLNSNQIMNILRSTHKEFVYNSVEQIEMVYFQGDSLTKMIISQLHALSANFDLAFIEFQKPKGKKTIQGSTLQERLAFDACRKAAIRLLRWASEEKPIDKKMMEDIIEFVKAVYPESFQPNFTLESIALELAVPMTADALIALERMNYREFYLPGLISMDEAKKRFDEELYELYENARANPN